MKLLELCQTIEIKMGRSSRHGFNEDRSIDIDILLFGDVYLNSKDLILPHPRMVHRSFVLDPLAEVAPHWIYGSKNKSVSTYLRELTAIDVI